MSLSKHQLAGKLSKKNLSLDEKMKFLDFAKGNPNFGCRQLAEIFKIGKTAAANILKDYVASMNYFVKNLRNVIGLASTKKSMTFYSCGIRDVVVRMFIRMVQC